MSRNTEYGQDAHLSPRSQSATIEPTKTPAHQRFPLDHT